MKRLHAYPLRGDVQDDQRTLARLSPACEKSSDNSFILSDKPPQFLANFCRHEAAEWMINMLNYEEAMIFINSFSKSGKPVHDLSRFSSLMNRLGKPQDNIKFIHIAGTNGKGSVLEYCSSVLIEKGYKVGQYTSPYIICYEDRIRINGKMISRDDLLRYINVIYNVANTNEGFSQFEITTAVMFMYFAEQKCDIVCMETGLGGLLDATNIIKTVLVSIITSVSYDHTAILGNTIEEIAFHKAGIIKENSIAVLYPENCEKVKSIVEATANSKNVKLVMPKISDILSVKYDINGTEFKYQHRQYNLSMVGEYQAYNAITAIEALKLIGFNLTDDDIALGLCKAVVPSRFEIISSNPLIILDGAHNPDAAKQLAHTIRVLFNGKKPNVIFGMLAEKNTEEIIKNISLFAKHVYILDNFSLGALPYSEICTQFRKNGISSEMVTLKRVKVLLEEKNEDFIICGSLYLASTIRNIIKDGIY